MLYCERLRCDRTDSNERAYSLSSLAAFSEIMAVPDVEVEALLRIEDRLVRELDGESACGRVAAGGGAKYDRSSLGIHGVRSAGPVDMGLERGVGRNAEREPNSLPYGRGAVLTRCGCWSCCCACCCSWLLLQSAVGEDARKARDGANAEFGVDGAVEVSKSAKRHGSEQ